MIASRRSIRLRHGVTLVETMVVLVLGGLVLSTVVQVGITLQRQFERAGARIAGAVQLREAAAILPLDLRTLSVRAGDIAAGEARDSTLEIRATIASGIVCAVEQGTDGALDGVFIAFPGDTPRDLPSRTPQPGDTLWLLDNAITPERWRPVSAGSVDGTTRCASSSGAVAQWSGFLLDRALRVRVSASAVDARSLVGTAIRVTRPERFSFYRASDGAWYFGLREWNAAAARFNPVQPVSGPYRTPHGAAHNDAGIRFRYFDSLGAVVPSGVADTRRITLVEVTLRTSLPNARAPADSLTIAVALRNRQ